MAIDSLSELTHFVRQVFAKRGMGIIMKVEVHGFWVIGALLLFAGTFLAGKIDFVEGATPVSVGVSALVSIVLILAAGAFWISASLHTE